jgi:hypothetical protein
VLEEKKGGGGRGRGEGGRGGGEAGESAEKLPKKITAGVVSKDSSLVSMTSYLVYFVLLKQNTMDWVIHKEQNFFSFSFLSFFVVLGIDSKASHMLDKCFATSTTSSAL